jgi:hypothetical protein
MRTFLFAATLTLLVHGAAVAQPGEPPAETREAMARLSFLVGSWKGEAWMQMGPGPRTEMTQTESVAAHLDGLVLAIEGEGRLKSNPDTITHLAFATITWDAEKKGYRVNAIRKDGKSIDAAGTFTADGAFQWGFAMMGGNVRYTIHYTAEGEWLETGDFSSDGTEWQQFLEMKLKRTK